MFALYVALTSALATTGSLVTSNIYKFMHGILSILPSGFLKRCQAATDSCCTFQLIYP